MARGVPARLTPAELRRFGFTVGAAFLALAAFAWWRDNSLLFRVLGAVGGALLLGGAVAPAALGPVHTGWMAFAMRLSRITTPIVMGVLFFGLITPTGWIARLFGYRPLTHGRGRDTYWIDRAPGARKSRLDKPF